MHKLIHAWVGPTAGFHSVEIRNIYFHQFHHKNYVKSTYLLPNYTVTLCSRNFQNVKLLLDFVEFDHFTATPILRQIKYLRIQTVKNDIFANFRGSKF